MLLPFVGAGELFRAIRALDNVGAVRFCLVRVQAEFGREFQIAIGALMAFCSVVTRDMRAQMGIGPESRAAEHADQVVIGMYFVHVLEDLAEVPRWLPLRAEGARIVVFHKSERLYSIIYSLIVGGFMLRDEMVD